MNYRKVFSLLLVWHMMTVAAWAEGVTYICLAKGVVGFHFDEVTKQWKREGFNVNDRKWLLSKSRTGWVAKKIGAPTSSALHKVSCVYSTFIDCEGPSAIYHFRMNPKSLRYIFDFEGGYIESGYTDAPLKEGDTTPHMEIGECTPLDTSD